MTFAILLRQLNDKMVKQQLYAETATYIQQPCWTSCVVFCGVQSHAPDTQLSLQSHSTSSQQLLPQADSVHALCRACYGVLRFIMESGAKGCEVIVSGKLRAQRAKAMKFKDGYMIASGHPAVEYIDGCVRHVMLRQGVLGIKVCRSSVVDCLSCLCSCICKLLLFSMQLQCLAADFSFHTCVICQCISYASMAPKLCFGNRIITTT